MPERDSETVTEETVRVRRSPRYARFMIVGAVFFVIVAFVLTYSLPQGQGYDRNAVFGYLALVAIAVGLGLGAVVALAFDRRSSRRAATVAADRVGVHSPEAEADGGPGEAVTASDSAGDVPTDPPQDASPHDDDPR
ncbi:MAG TPA: hypothetical protein VN133_09795 [Humibacter sp.]|nr:hypothetical protein [Humibacter sp.]